MRTRARRAAADPPARRGPADSAITSPRAVVAERDRDALRWNQLRVLVRRRELPRAGVLLLHGPRTRRASERTPSNPRRRVGPKAAAATSPSWVTTTCAACPTRAPPSWTSTSPPTKPGRVAPAGTSTATPAPAASPIRTHPPGPPPDNRRAVAPVGRGIRAKPQSPGTPPAPGSPSRPATCSLTSTTEPIVTHSTVAEHAAPNGVGSAGTTPASSVRAVSGADTGQRSPKSLSVRPFGFGR